MQPPASGCVQWGWGELWLIRRSMGRAASAMLHAPRRIALALLHGRPPCSIPGPHLTRAEEAAELREEFARRLGEHQFTIDGLKVGRHELWQGGC